MSSFLLLISKYFSVCLIRLWNTLLSITSKWLLFFYLWSSCTVHVQCCLTFVLHLFSAQWKYKENTASLKIVYDLQLNVSLHKHAASCLTSCWCCQAGLVSHIFWHLFIYIYIFCISAYVFPFGSRCLHYLSVYCLHLDKTHFYLSFR